MYNWKFWKVLCMVLWSLFLEHVSALYWYVCITLVRGLTNVGLVPAAEWIARRTGLRLRVLALLRGVRW
jgi:hypothetical protein